MWDSVLSFSVSGPSGADSLGIPPITNRLAHPPAKAATTSGLNQT